ncbi:MAG: Ni/Fe hydrogenase subunit alpha [Spirochaetales bacterium]|nr:Ni/Fe hydrogenase subunit alpha [Spirochaetales bacterium]
MSKRITIDPITRLEGHGKIEIFLNDAGDVERAYLQIPEIRGFEKFVEGRPAEEMPQITSRICGVCPGAHHMASTKTLDSLFGVQPTEAARAIRELYYHLHFFEDHILHFYILGGPDFIVGPDADPAERNILGVIGKVGVETGKKVIDIRKRARHMVNEIAGKNVHPVLGLPGGVAKPFPGEQKETLLAFAADAVEFSRFTLDTFNSVVLENKTYLDLILSDTYLHKTYYMGMVDDHSNVEFYDGNVRVIDHDGIEVTQFTPPEYANVIAEHVEPWSYIKFPFLKEIGWKGFVDGKDSGIYRVAPLARLNAAEGMSTPLAQEEYERYFSTLGGKPVHNTLANHWARLVEILYSAEKIKLLSESEELYSPDVRNMDLQTPSEGFGIVEAPRGTLIHHYKTDERGVMTGCNLIVASLGNSAAMCMSIDRAARSLIKGGEVNQGLLNMVEMAFRAYDPCFGCATHSFPGKESFQIHITDPNGKLTGTVVRNGNGKIGIVKQ